ncbi:4491_t:CDS:2 [Ambispora gerdemannii]|uniref:4491_t:CDS:1 n=1 Tax=Ambispora gerdemannii TaxID=144530 RepID=A0A9N8WP59_9GLOM|nr:4491_t:CDS:2 [Ambispora gerdemannii]
MSIYRKLVKDSSSSPLSNHPFDSEMSGIEDEEEKLLLKQALIMSLETNVKLQNHFEIETQHTFIWRYVIKPCLLIAPICAVALILKHDVQARLNIYASGGDEGA